jgi:predicted DNA-binding transcriptional regulator YafY
MKNERLMAMIDCLLRDGRSTAESLASRFEVSVRTIYRDIDSLCMAGVPVVAESGSGGGYRIDPAYRVDRSFLSKDEIADLSALLRGMPEALKDGHIERSLGKISSLGPRGREAPAAGTPLPPAFIASLSPWGAPGPDPESVIALRRAIADRAVVSFEYVDGEGRGSRRTVEPFTLVIGGAVWYLHAFCRLRSEWRLFKLSRIRSLKAGLERFDPCARLPAPHPFQDWNESLITVSLAVEPRLASVVEDAMPGSAAGSFDDGSTLFVFEYPDGEWLVKLLLSFGPGIRILGPARLRSAFQSAARAMADANADTI